jgi:hypothetical protein
MRTAITVHLEAIVTLNASIQKSSVPRAILLKALARILQKVGFA